MYQNDALKCLIQNARLSYCALTEPRAPQNGIGKAKYSVTLLIPKTDAAARADIDSAIHAAITEGKDKAWQGIMPPQPHLPIHDGDGPRESGELYGEECRGCWVITASSTQKPQVVDAQLNPIVNPSDIYSGMYGHVTVRFFAYVNTGKKGIGCGLGNVMKTADGEALSGHADAKTDFAGIAQEPQAPAYPTYGQQAPAAPQYPQYAAQQPTEMPQGYAQAPAASGYPGYAQPQAPAAYPQYPQQY